MFIKAVHNSDLGTLTCLLTLLLFLSGQLLFISLQSAPYKLSKANSDGAPGPASEDGSAAERGPKSRLQFGLLRGCGGPPSSPPPRTLPFDFMASPPARPHASAKAVADAAGRRRPNDIHMGGPHAPRAVMLFHPHRFSLAQQGARHQISFATGPASEGRQPRSAAGIDHGGGSLDGRATPPSPHPPRTSPFLLRAPPRIVLRSPRPLMKLAPGGSNTLRIAGYPARAPEPSCSSIATH